MALNVETIEAALPLVADALPVMGSFETLLPFVHMGLDTSPGDLLMFT